MTLFLLTASILAMLAVLVVLGLGFLNLARGGGGERSNRLMRLRVLFQAIALVLLFSLAWLLHNGH